MHRQTLNPSPVSNINAVLQSVHTVRLLWARDFLAALPGSRRATCFIDIISALQLIFIYESVHVLGLFVIKERRKFARR